MSTTALDPLAQDLQELGVGGVFISDSNVLDVLQVQTLAADLQEGSRDPACSSPPTRKPGGSRPSAD